MGKMNLNALYQYTQDWAQAGLQCWPIFQPEEGQEVVEIIEEPQWDQLKSEALACTGCDHHQTRQKVCLEKGSPTAELLILGLSPDPQDDMEGSVFSGAPGQLFDRMLTAMGGGWDKAYATYLVKCAGAQVGQLDDQAEARCRPFFEKQCQWVRPQVVLVLGQRAAQSLWEDSSPPLGEWTEYQGSQALVIHHPAALIRDPGLKKEVWDQLQNVRDVLGWSS